MKLKNLTRIAAICIAVIMALAPISASAAPLIKKGARGTEVKMIQTTLKELGYFTYPKATGFYGSVTEKAVKRFQKDNGISADGVVGKKTRNAMYGNTQSMATSDVSLFRVLEEGKKGDLDWFSEVQYIWPRGTDALVTDVDTGKSFEVRRTFGTNHADVEPVTMKDSNIIKSIWNGWSWERRAVVVQIGEYTIAGSLSAMPHAGVESQPAVKIVNARSGNYGRGHNLDAVKGNGVSGVMDLHFKNSRTHSTNTLQKSHQDMVKKAAQYIERMGY